MGANVWLAWIHYVVVIAMSVVLVLETLKLKQLAITTDTPLQLASLGRVDLWVGITAVAALATGFARIPYEKGWDYYLAHPGFHALVGSFVLASVLSIYPTVKIIRWRNAIKTNATMTLTADAIKPLRIVLHVELLLLVFMPLFAAWMARGYY